ncbi:MAG: TfoX/Sxy family protein [Rubrivivax sp.]
MPDAAADAFAAHCAELLAGSGTVRLRRMFGGHGLSLDGLPVALVSRHQLYLKVDAESRPAFEAAGSAPFVYQRQGRTATLGYWTAPDDALDSPDAMRPWARRALQAALSAAAAARPKRARPARGPTPPSPAAAAAAAGTQRRAKPPR